MLLPAVVVGLAILGALGFILWRRYSTRVRHPQDFAFAICTGFGPDLGLPRAVRILRVLPRVPDEEIARWLEDFSRLDTTIEALARAGGPEHLGRDVVQIG